jgi:hypothetical protein
MTLILKALGGISALILLVIALFSHLITVVGVLLVAIKIGIVLIFLALVVMIAFSILRDRSRRRQEAEDI